MSKQLSPLELLNRIQKDLTLLAPNAVLFGRGAELDLKKAAKIVSDIKADIVTPEPLNALDTDQHIDEAAQLIRYIHDLQLAKSQAEVQDAYDGLDIEIRQCQTELDTICYKLGIPTPDIS